mgnify:CR=1 FL=1
MTSDRTTIRALLDAGAITMDTVVLGDISRLPKTTDGAIEFPQSRPWHLFNDGEIVQESEHGEVKHSKYGTFSGNRTPRFSTKEAAEHAREASCPPATSANPPARS